MNCPKCNQENVNDAKYCIECGTPLLKVCENCGKLTQWTTKFCPECGDKFPVFDLTVEYYKRKMNFYDEINIVNSAEGKYVLVKNRHKYKLLNVHDLKQTTPYEFEDIGRYVELNDYNFVLVKKDALWGLINPMNGQIICDFKYDDYILVYLEGTYTSNGTVLLKEKGKWGKVDGNNGKVILPFIYDEIYDYGLDDYHNDFDLLKYDGYWGVIASGEQIVPFEYIKLGYRVVDRWSYLNDFGTNDESIPPSQHKNGKWGIINIYNGEIILKPDYDEIESFGDNTYKVRKGVKWGVINNRNGKIILECEYDELENFERSTYKVKKRGKWGLANSDGTLLLAYEFDDIYYEINIQGFAFTMRKGGKWGKVIYDPLYASYGPSTKYDCIYSEDEIKKLR